MLTPELIQDINIGCIVFLILSLIILIAATGLKNGIAYMALATISTTVPVYLSNLMRELGSDAFEMSLYIAGTINVLCFPALWFFIHSQLDRPFRFKPWMWLHFVPSLVSLAANLIFYLPLNDAEVEAERLLLNSGTENAPALVNDVILFSQYFIYFTNLILYVRKQKKFLMENYSDNDYLLMMWMPRFLYFFCGLFTIVFIAYIINPRSDVWLIPILNTAGMTYLIYSSIRYVPHIEIPRPAPVAQAPAEETAAPLPSISEKEMENICRQASDFAVTSKIYLNSELTLGSFAQESGISQRTLSRAINGYLHCNFFEFINNMRIEEAKRLLLDLEKSGFSIESIYSECGFRSRSTFFGVFKKVTGFTPAAWLKAQKEV